MTFAQSSAKAFQKGRKSRQNSVFHKRPKPFGDRWSCGPVPSVNVTAAKHAGWITKSAYDERSWYEGVFSCMFSVQNSYFPSMLMLIVMFARDSFKMASSIHECNWIFWIDATVPQVALSTTLALRPIIGGGIYLQCDSAQVFVQDEKGDGIFYCSSVHSSNKSIKRMWGGVSLINLGQCSRPHMAETSALVTKTLV